MSNSYYYYKEPKFKTRNWTFLVYPDSAPDNWRDIIDDFHVPWVESPLHDKDQNPLGDAKKPHWHVMVQFDGPKTFKNVCSLFSSLNNPEPQPCNSAVGLVRYMAHLDNPEKYQYDRDAIIGHGGFDVQEILEMRSGEELEQIGCMMDFVQQNCILEYFDLITYARQYRQHDWFPLLCKKYTFVMKEFINSYRRHLDDEEKESSFNV